MELIPILSLIILVATISTFILSVGAYILYKIRERKNVGAQAPQPAAIPAEYVTPAPLVEQRPVQQPERRTFEIARQQEYEAHRQPSYPPQQENRGPELRPTFVGSGPAYTEKYQKPTPTGERATEGDRYGAKRKFMRYTNEGYVEASKQEKKQEDNLRWR